MGLNDAIILQPKKQRRHFDESRQAQKASLRVTGARAKAPLNLRLESGCPVWWQLLPSSNKGVDKTLPWHPGPAAKVRILRVKNLPPFGHDRGLQNHV
jgi:hypothetical protein